MKAPTIDLTRFDETISVFEKIRDHRRVKPTFKTEELYYDLMAKNLREVRQASEAGKPFVCYSLAIPNEIFVAMDLPSTQAEIAGTIPVVLGNYDEVLHTAARLGLRAEICSPYRLFTGVFAKGWFPRPTVLINSTANQCDNMSQSFTVMGEIYDVPVFMVSQPYYWWREKGVKFMIGELEDLIAFLEERTFHRMDWDKLKEAIRLSSIQVELMQEIRKLAMFTPCPMKAKIASFSRRLRWIYAGRPEGVSFFKTFRDELKERVEQKKGVVPEERSRIMSLFTPPNPLRLLDWLEEERGMVFVAEPYYFRWENWGVDSSKPLESLARKYYCDPYWRWYGMLSEYLDMAVNEAIESQAEGAINWFNSKCTMGGATARIVEETLMEKAGIPTLSCEVDTVIPSPATEKVLKEGVDRFIEVLKARK